jgi:hypothetical protein
MSDRVNPFGDMNDFAPVSAKNKSPKTVEKAVIDQVAADNGFPSRKPAKSETKPVPRPQRRYTTGRNQQINVKATAETIERFYRIADDMNVPLGEVLSRALDALQKTGK